MNKTGKSFLRFFVDFIESFTEEPCSSEYMVRKMMKNKKVQAAIVDCIYKLEPILSDEFSAFKGKNRKRNINISFHAKLIHLSEDVKKLMGNFDKIKDKIASVNDIVETIDSNLKFDLKVAENKITEESSALVEYLREITGKEVVKDVVFEELSGETWSKHVEVEKMLKSEMAIYEAKMLQLMNKNFSAICQIKNKAGLKIKSLEETLEIQKNWFLGEIEKRQMKIEDLEAAEIRKIETERELIKNELKVYVIPDLPTAVKKIKSLLTVKQILEKNRKEDEKIIESLNNKIKVIADQYFECHEQLTKSVQNFSSIALCLGKVIEKSGLEESDKLELVENLNNLECKTLENRFEDDFLVDFIAGKVYVLKLRAFLSNPQNDPKDENFKEKILRFLEEDFEKSKKGTKRNSAISTRRSSPGKAKKSGQSPTKDPESPYLSLKRILGGIDSEIKLKNRQLTENLSDMIYNLKYSPYKTKKEAKDLKVKTNYIDIQVPRSSIVTENSTQTDSDFQILFQLNKEIQASCPSSHTSAQTALSFSEVNQFEDYFVSHNFIEQYRVHMAPKLCGKETQTEKKYKFKEFEDSKLLIKGLMKKRSVIIQRLKAEKIEEGPERIKEEPEKIIESSKGIYLTETKTVREQPKTLENLPDNKESLSSRLTPIPTYQIAQEEYKKEFEIYSQFLGYKKFDFSTLQKIWEEVINRRLTEGEEDHITSHLRTVLNTDIYEEEKLKTVKMLMKLKSDANIDNNFNNFLKAFQKTLFSLSKWRSLLSAYILKNLPKIIPQPSIYHLFIFSKMTQKPSQNPSQKKIENLEFKTQNWRISTKSPVITRRPKQILSSKPRLEKTRAKSPAISKQEKPKFF